MSHPVELTRTVHALVEEPAPDVEVYDVRRAELSPPVVRAFRPGRLTLTKRELTFHARRLEARSQSFTVELLDVVAVALDGGVVPRVVTVTTRDGARYHLRMSGAAAFAKRVAITREAVQRRAALH